MSGYREHGFDPNAYEQPRRPLRPYNWVQWLGVALGSAGLVLALVDFADRFGWAAPFDPSTGVIVALCGSAMILINSRRERRDTNSQGA